MLEQNYKQMAPYRLNGKSIPQLLEELGQKGNRAFTESLHPGIEHILGCRVPALRQLAKTILHDDWKLYLLTAGTYYMEERLLYGLVVSGLDPGKDFHEYLNWVTLFVERINSWSVCDAFTFRETVYSGHRMELWNYLIEQMQGSKAYANRFGVVMSMRYFIDEEHLPALFKAWSGVRNESYYVKMAVAWALSEAFVKYPEATMRFLQDEPLDKDTLHKALQKIIESRRVSQASKEAVRHLKAKIKH